MTWLRVLQLFLWKIVFLDIFFSKILFMHLKIRETHRVRGTERNRSCIASSLPKHLQQQRLDQTEYQEFNWGFPNKYQYPTIWTIKYWLPRCTSSGGCNLEWSHNSNPGRCPSSHLKHCTKQPPRFVTYKLKPDFCYCSDFWFYYIVIRKVYA